MDSEQAKHKASLHRHEEREVAAAANRKRRNLLRHMWVNAIMRGRGNVSTNLPTTPPLYQIVIWMSARDVDSCLVIRKTV